VCIINLEILSALAKVRDSEAFRDLIGLFNLVRGLRLTDSPSMMKMF